MYINTRTTLTIFVLLVVATTSVLLVSSITMAGLAASSDLSHGSSKTGDQSRTNDSVNVNDNNITHSTKINNPSMATINENPNLDTLLACESGAANGSGHLTMSEVMNCYLQFSRGSASSLAILGDHQNSDRTGAGSGSDSTSNHDVSSTTIHLNGQHKGEADSTSHGRDRTIKG